MEFRQAPEPSLSGDDAVFAAAREYELCYPPRPAMTRIREIFPVAFARNGADPHIGRRYRNYSARQGLRA